LDDALKARVTTAIRAALTFKRVPNKIIAAPDATRGLRMRIAQATGSSFG
jgi:hypothetical protein